MTHKVCPEVPRNDLKYDVEEIYDKKLLHGNEANDDSKDYNLSESDMENGKSFHTVRKKEVCGKGPEEIQRNLYPQP